MVRQIDAKALKTMMDSGTKFVLIDARSQMSYQKEHIPGAVSVPSDHIAEHVLGTYPKSLTFVTYCTDFDCEASTIAAKKLEKLGFADVLEYKGGLEDWKMRGYATEK